MLRHQPARITPAGEHPWRGRVTGAVLGLQRAAGNRAVAGMIVQRSAEWTGGQQVRALNPTDPLWRGTDYGTTWALLNTVRFPGGNPKTVLRPPTFAFPQVAEGQFEAQVTGEAVNTTGYQMDLPADPPWERRAPSHAAVSAIELLLRRGNIPALAPYKRDDDVRLIVRGLPDDHTFRDLVERHENEHVRHLKVAHDSYLHVWDLLMTNLMRGGRSPRGASPAEAEANFYRLCVRTPEAVGQRIIDYFADQGNNFHDTRKGASPTIVKIGTTKDTSILVVYLKHALG